ncbi:MAG: ABC transporter ATP-binding protein [Alphaproteobacteria bacterium]
MLAWFERLTEPYRTGPEGAPPNRLWPFYLHYAGQIRWLIVATLAVGLAAAIVEVALFAFLGRLVDMVRAAETPSSFFADHAATLLGMGFVALVARPVLLGLHALLINQGVTAGFTNLVRWQTHRWVLRQNLGFFQNDFAGRIANKIMQTGPSLRESVIQVVDALWFVSIYTLSALALFWDVDARLMAPLILWIAGFVAAIAYFVPRVGRRAAVMSEARSTLAGRIVDSYTNMATVKLFAHTDREEDQAKRAFDDHTATFNAQLRVITFMEVTIWALNGTLITATAALALWLWSQGLVTVGAIALAVGLVIRLVDMSGWIMWVLTSIFENIGTVQEGMETIARPHGVVDRPNAPALQVPRGEIAYENVSFHYGKGRGVIDDLSLTIGAGEKVGLVGRSGAGKSTLVNLLLRFYDLEGGRIRIDGQDIAEVSQESLRARIGMVTQDTSLLHRSIRDNILYGDPTSGESAAWAAARRAQADGFIPELEDARGRRGMDAHVGERGVKLSGGQRQRIAIARVLLKDAPILILDEATSALDSEIEQAIQEQLANLMAGKTVIAIAHRLSTIAAMDRLIVMDAGRIVEAGGHAELVARGGLYAQLWRRQSGGFLAPDAAAG